MVEITQLGIDQTGALQAISIETFTHTFKDQNTPEDLQAYIEKAYQLDVLAAEIANPDSFFYFIKDEDEIMGYLKLNKGMAQSEQVEENALEVERIYIRPHAKRKGYGKRLLDKAIAVAQQHGCKAIWLGVWEHNQAAKAFYTRMGFERVGEHVFYMGEDAQTDEILLKKL